MKTCTDCPSTFTGFGTRCDPCRRRFEKHGPKLTDGGAEAGMVVSDADLPAPVEPVFVEESPDAIRSDDDIIDIDGVPSCRLCERPMRTLTGAERVKRHRERKLT